jgi:uncharacterized OsmC-like protein
VPIDGRARVGFEVSVTGHKAPEPPSRLAKIELGVTFDASLPLAEAQGLVEAAERLCTVTNTLTSEPRCLVSIGLIRKSLARPQRHRD